MAENKMSFEAAFSRLEEIADVLESGDADLEQTIALFEEANQLNKICTDQLDKAENKLKILVKKNDEFTLEPEEN